MPKQAVHVRLFSPNDFLITPTGQETQVIVRSGDQWVTILMPRAVSLQMAVQLIQAEAKQIQREAGRQVQPVIIFEQVSGL